MEMLTLKAGETAKYVVVAYGESRVPVWKKSFVSKENALAQAAEWKSQGIYKRIHILSNEII